MIKDQNVRGFIDAVTAFTLWGLLPIYWHLLSHVHSTEVLLHRIIWCAVALAIYFGTRKQFLSSLKPLIQDRRIFGFLFVNAFLISGNWWLYIWAVNHGHVLETSLGYFINPILSVLLGAIILKERLSILQWIAVLIVCVALSVNVIQSGSFPWIALTLALTFAFYGLIKKMAGVGSVESLWFETAVAALPSLLAFAYLVGTEQSAFVTANPSTRLLLIGAGLLTAAPLVFFGWAAKRLKLATIGFLQFIAPSLQFVLGVWYFGEKLDGGRFIAFIFVWIAIGLYLLGSAPRRAKKQQNLIKV